MHFYFYYKRNKDYAGQIDFTKKRKAKEKISIIEYSQISSIWTKSDTD